MWSKVKGFLLSPLLVLAFAGALTGIVLAILIFGPQKEPTVKDMWEDPAPDRYLTTFPADLYYDQALEQNGYLPDLLDAVSSWYAITGGRADFNVCPWEGADFNPDIFETYPKHTVWLLDGNDPRVAMLFVQNTITMGGLSSGRYMGIIKDEELTSAQRRVVFAHELGHLMGLTHIKNKYPALMNYTAQPSIGKYDVALFDYVYAKRP